MIFFLFVIYSVRKLGDVDFGVYSYAYSFTGMFLIVMDLGLNTLLIRDVAGDRTKLKKYVSNLMWLKLVLFAVAFGAITLLAGQMHEAPDKIRFIRLMSIFTVAMAFLRIWLCHLQCS